MGVTTHRLCLLTLAWRCSASAPQAEPLQTDMDDIPADDTSSLLQLSSQLQPQGRELAPDFSVLGPKACGDHPGLCAAPFNCQNANGTKVKADVQQHGLAPGGNINWQHWCLDSRYEHFITKCAAGDLAGAALVQYRDLHRGVYGPGDFEMTGSWCVMEGYCHAGRHVVTTWEESVRECDARFGRDVWTAFLKADSPPADRIVPPEIGKGLSTAAQARPYGLASCATHTYHCDARLCQEFCKNEHFVHTYGHLSGINLQ